MDPVERRFPAAEQEQRFPIADLPLNSNPPSLMNTPSPQMPRLRYSVLKICLCLPWMLFLQAQSTSRQLTPLLERETLEPGLVHHLLGSNTCCPVLHNCRPSPTVRKNGRLR